MCNLYHVAPENDLESYIRRHLGKVHVPEWPSKPTVGPFDTGAFLVAADVPSDSTATIVVGRLLENMATNLGASGMEPRSVSPLLPEPQALFRTINRLRRRLA